MFVQENVPIYKLPEAVMLLMRHETNLSAYLTETFVELMKNELSDTVDKHKEIEELETLIKKVSNGTNHDTTKNGFSST
jgi:hypothetical protein